MRRPRPRPRLSRGLWFAGVVGQFAGLFLPSGSVSKGVAQGLGLALMGVAIPFWQAPPPKKPRVDDPNGLRWYQNPENF